MIASIDPSRNIEAFLTDSERFLINGSFAYGMIIDLDEKAEVFGKIKPFRLSVDRTLTRSVGIRGVDFGVQYIRRPVMDSLNICFSLYNDLEELGYVNVVYADDNSKMHLVNLKNASAVDKKEFERLSEYSRRF